MINEKLKRIGFAFFLVLSVISMVSCATAQNQRFADIREHVALLLSLSEDSQTQKPASESVNEQEYAVEYVVTEDFLQQFKEKDEAENVSKSELVNSINDENKISVVNGFQFENSIVRYNFENGKRYDIFMSPYALTDIRLGEDDTEVSIVLSDSANWDILDPVEGSEDGKSYLHYFIRPRMNGLICDCNIITDTREYFLRLYSSADTSMVGVRWIYPHKNIYGNRIITSVSGSSESSGSDGTVRYKVDPTSLNYNYKIKGTSKWAPILAFNDNSHTYIQFDSDFDKTSSAPVLYIKKNGEMIEITNYIVKNNIYVVPLLLDEGQYFVFVQGEAMAIVARKNTVI